MRAARLAALTLVAVTAAAPPAVALSLATTYLCFFATGSAELSLRCRDSVLQFADMWHRMRRGEVRGWPDEPRMPAYTMRVEVQGHADEAEATVGEASLGKVRAEAVAAFLRLNGLPADVMEVTAFGADRPLVVTSEAEPQNRSVELIAR